MRRKWYIKFERWPWQMQHLGVFSGRFGGGWEYALGLKASRPNSYGWTLIIDLLFGSVRLGYRSPKEDA
jgi:hypothetical protein